MAELMLAPNHPALLYDQYFEVFKSAERAYFRRCYDPQHGCEMPSHFGFGKEFSYHPGARVAMLTDATRVHAVLEYVHPCESGCPGTLPDHCYRPDAICRGSSHFMCGPCRNHCEPKVYVDGVLTQMPEGSAGQRPDIGLVPTDVLLVDFTGASSARARLRRIELVMPWGGEVHIRGFRLCCGNPQPRVSKPSGSAFKFVAYGDSIVQGFCGAMPFPEVLGRLNGWNSINLGIGGLWTFPEHGASIGNVGADLVLLLIGTNNWWRSCSVGSEIDATIDGFRHESPHAPLVIGTMIVRADEPGRNPKNCVVLEDFRQQIRDVVAKRRAAGDHKLYTIEGKPLLSVSRLGDGLHPGSSDAQEELAANLNAQLGFAAVQYMRRCDGASQMIIDAHGLTPNGRCGLQWGAELRNTILSDPPCQARSLMVGGLPGKWLSSVADARGHASFTLEAPSACTSAVHFQVIDLVTCVVSRVGRGSDDASSVVGTAAENFAAPPPPLPPSPPPPSRSPATPPPPPPPPPHSPLPAKPPPQPTYPEVPQQQPTPRPPLTQEAQPPPPEASSPIPPPPTPPSSSTRDSAVIAFSAFLPAVYESSFPNASRGMLLEASTLLMAIAIGLTLSLRALWICFRRRRKPTRRASRASAPHRPLASAAGFYSRRQPSGYDALPSVGVAPCASSDRRRKPKVYTVREQRVTASQRAEGAARDRE